MRRPFLLVALWLLTLMLLSPYALAATLQVAPVTLDLDNDQRATAVYLTNSGNTPIHAQIRVYDWTQENGLDRLTQTDAVVSSPAMTSLAPGQQQLVRIIVLQPGARAQEQSYRLVIDELPAGAPDASHHNAVHFMLRYSIPVFIAGTQAPGSNDSALRCEVASSGATIQCHNTSDHHIRLSNVQALAADGQVVETLKGLAGYVLPGQMYVLTLKKTPRHPLSALRAWLNENHQPSKIDLRPLTAGVTSLARDSALSPR